MRTLALTTTALHVRLLIIHHCSRVIDRQRLFCLHIIISGPCETNQQLNNKAVLKSGTKHSRNGVSEWDCVDSAQPVDHHDDANNRGRKEPSGVKSKPSKVDANLLTKVTPTHDVCI